MLIPVCRCVLLLALLWCRPAPAAAQEVVTPLAVQYPLFLKMLTYDRSLDAHPNDDLVLGVVYQSRFRASLTTKDELLREASASPLKRVKSRNVRVVPLEADRAEDLVPLLRKHGIDALYVCPLRALSPEDVAAASAAARVVTLTGVPAYVRRGLAVGIDLQERKPRMLINLPAAVAAGSDFNARLLQLAEVIR